MDTRSTEHIIEAPMRILSALALLFFSSSLLASPMRWDFDNVAFDDGTTVTGFIIVDPATEEVLEVDLLTEAGTIPSIRTAKRYRNAAASTYDTDGDSNGGVPFLNIRLEDDARSGTYYYANVFDFTLANPAPLNQPGVVSIGEAATGYIARETSCGYQASYPDYIPGPCIENLSGERNATGTLTGSAYDAPLTYLDDNRSGFWLGSNPESGTYNDTYLPDAPFADFVAAHFLRSYLRSGTIYTSASVGAASVGSSNGRTGAVFDVTFYLTAPTEITITGNVSGTDEEYGSGSGEVILYSGSELNPDNQVYRAYASSYDSRDGYGYADVDFTQVLPAGQYRLWGEAKSYYQIGYGRFLIDATLSKAGPSGLNNTDSDGDWLRDDYEIMQFGTDPNSADTDIDGFSDFEELFNGFDPLDPTDTSVDSDGDYLTDAAEIIWYKTNPESDDTDGDWLRDGLEILWFATNPLNPDTDGDGTWDFSELWQGRNPNVPDGPAL
jgi:hypothetical protein